MKKLSITLIVISLAFNGLSQESRAYNLRYFDCQFNPFSFIDLGNNDHLSLIKMARDSISLAIPYDLSVKSDSSTVTFIVTHNLSKKQNLAVFEGHFDVTSTINIFYYRIPKQWKAFGISCSRDRFFYQLVKLEDKLFLYYGDIHPDNLILSW